MEYKLVDNIILTCKDLLKKNEEISLEKLVLKDPSFQLLWYKMLKGTKYYDFKNKTGMPSILEFITIKETSSQKNKICIPKASQEMLTALFNEDIALKIQKAQIKFSEEEVSEEDKKIKTISGRTVNRSLATKRTIKSKVMLNHTFPLSNSRHVKKRTKNINTIMIILKMISPPKPPK